MLLATDSAQLLDLNGTFLVEVAAFLIMLAILGKFVYPKVIEAAEARQRQIAEHLAEAERARKEAEERLRQVEEHLGEARKQAQEIIAGAGKSAEQLRQELRRNGDEEARRMVERAQAEIEAERRRAIDSVRGEVADLVVAATERVVGESLDSDRHQKLIEGAIRDVVGNPTVRSIDPEVPESGNGKR